MTYAVRLAIFARDITERDARNAQMYQISKRCPRHELRQSQTSQCYQETLTPDYGRRRATIDQLESRWAITIFCASRHYCNWRAGPTITSESSASDGARGSSVPEGAKRPKRVQLIGTCFLIAPVSGGPLWHRYRLSIQIDKAFPANSRASLSHGSDLRVI